MKEKKVKIYCDHDWDKVSSVSENDVCRECLRCEAVWYPNEITGKYAHEPKISIGYYCLGE